MSSRHNRNFSSHVSRRARPSHLCLISSHHQEGFFSYHATEHNFVPFSSHFVSPAIGLSHFSSRNTTLPPPRHTRHDTFSSQFRETQVRLIHISFLVGIPCCFSAIVTVGLLPRLSSHSCLVSPSIRLPPITFRVPIFFHSRVTLPHHRSDYFRRIGLGIGRAYLLNLSSSHLLIRYRNFSSLVRKTIWSYYLLALLIGFSDFSCLLSFEFYRIV